jgi:hypothetical protein
MWLDMHIKFHDGWYKHSNSINVFITDVKDLLKRPLRWAQVP